VTDRTSLVVTDLHAGYGDMEVVSGVSLAVETGQMVALIGRNGAGKSTTLHALAGLRHSKASGSVFFGGIDLSRATPRQAVMAGIALVPEGHRVFGDLSVLENLELGAYPWHRQRRLELQGDVERVMTLFPILAEFSDRQAGQLSGGQQQMVAIGQALIARPSVLLLDEPSSGLAPGVVETIYDAMATMRNDGIALLVVEQDVDRSLATCDVVNVMESGKIVLSGPSSELIGNRNVANIVRGIADIG